MHQQRRLKKESCVDHFDSHARPALQQKSNSWAEHQRCCLGPRLWTIRCFEKAGAIIWSCGGSMGGGGGGSGGGVRSRSTATHRLEK